MKQNKAKVRSLFITYFHKIIIEASANDRGFQNSLEPVRLDLGEDCAGHTRSFEVIQYHPTWSIATGRSRAKIVGSHPCRGNTAPYAYPFLSLSLSFFFFDFRLSNTGPLDFSSLFKRFHSSTVRATFSPKLFRMVIERRRRRGGLISRENESKREFATIAYE